ncbi:ankyrin repeat-containing domain protein [Tribonema minus]|uniref:Ankyrin repeat-containing domain protein n=1 Tax=Tribonema minus TaxID=303371 RepID=A0A835Z8V9_9STRA|nr:ankyrin repeat-containing domain protein [Tribonema minus]
MACGYGVEQMVHALLKAGADPNTTNCYTWTPLLEACHKGFEGIALALLKAGADVSHIPSEGASNSAQFLRGPPQTPLGEAARAGHVGICRALLSSGADKDTTNAIGWTPLHEDAANATGWTLLHEACFYSSPFVVVVVTLLLEHACFYSHVDVVTLLLTHGADATRPNSQGALPFHMTTAPAIRDAIQAMAPPAAVSDVTLPTLVFAVDEETGQMFIGLQTPKSAENGAGDVPTSSEKKGSPKGGRGGHGSRGGGGGGGGATASERGSAAHRLLHSGTMLGNLPSLATTGEAPPVPEVAEAKKSHSSSSNSAQHHSTAQQQRRSSTGSSVEARTAAALAVDAPPNFKCNLSRRLMRDPVRTPYGNVYDRAMIAMWLQQQGSIDPLTGQPLVEAELKEDGELKSAIESWVQAHTPSTTAPAAETKSCATQQAPAAPGATSATLTDKRGLGATSKPLAATAPVSPLAAKGTVDEDDGLYEF